MNYRILDWADIEEMCWDLYHKIKEEEYDAILGLLRGGVVPAVLLSDYMEMDFYLYTMKIKNYSDLGKMLPAPIIGHLDPDIFASKKLLVIDDIWDSGKTMNAALSKLVKKNTTTATLFKRVGSEGEPDHYIEETVGDEWIVFPWEKKEFERHIKSRGMPCVVCSKKFNPIDTPGGILFGPPDAIDVDSMCSKQHVCPECWGDLQQRIVMGGKK